jgi:alpha-galactosidase
VWAGPLSNNKIVVVLWNKSSSNATVTASWSDIGLKPENIVDARDLWEVRYLAKLISLFIVQLNLNS